MIYFENLSTDPAWNMAVEEALLLEAREEPLLLLWENAPSVIIGRHQNVWSEVNIAYAKQKNIRIIRRLSGGGAVYHDNGNLNYTFIVPVENGSSKCAPVFDFKSLSAPVVKVLRKMGLNAEFSGRNDIIIDNRKISGTAQVRFHGHLLHHGTLLFSTDLEKMTHVLTVDPEKYHSKGVPSVRARVANLSEFLPEEFGKEQFKQIILDELSKDNAISYTTFSHELIETINRLKENKYGTDTWNIGRSPRSDFYREKRFSWGKLRADVTLERGKIVNLSFSGDFFFDEDPLTLAQYCLGVEYTRVTLRCHITEEKIKSVFPKLEKEEFISFLCD